MKLSEPRIALCLSGQPRTWKSCYKNWQSAFSNFGDKIDIFCHFWDYNSLPRQSYVLGKNSPQTTFEDVAITDDEKQEIIETLLPKRIEFEPKLTIPSDFYKVKNRVSWWSIDQFNSIMKCAHLKRSYELENRFQYDIVFRLRSDLIFTNQIQMISEIQPNTLHSIQNAFDQHWNTYRISDIFFYADSHTYDQAAAFYKHLRHIDAVYVTRDQSKLDFPPELAFYYHLKSIGVNIKQVWISPLVKRTQEYLDIKGKLDEYETI